MERFRSKYDKFKKDEVINTPQVIILPEQVFKFGPDGRIPLEQAELYKEALQQLAQEMNAHMHIVSTHGKIGAGHVRQAEFLRRFFAELQIPHDHTSLDMSHMLESKIYEWFQNTPLAHQIFNDHLVDQIPHSYIDWVIENGGDLNGITEAIGDLDPNKLHVFLTTHSQATSSVMKLLEKKSVSHLPQYALIEFPPDPWYTEKEIGSMTYPHPKRNPNHFVVTHDKKAAEAYVEAGKVNNKRGSHVLAFGTLSPYEFLFEKSPEYSDNERPHILIEFSGNDIIGFRQKIIEALSGSAHYFRKNDPDTCPIDLTIHVMNHQESARIIKEILQDLGINNSPHIHMVVSESLEDAVRSRELLLVGKYQQNPNSEPMKRPTICISKGGEATIEDRDGMLTMFIWGKAHEENDGLVGIQEGRAYDARHVPPGQLITLAQALHEKRLKEKKEGILTPQTQSVALLAPLYVLAAHRSLTK